MTSQALLGVIGSLFVGCVVLLAACERRASAPSPSPSSSSPPVSGKLTFLALGDSYTVGESVSPAERWPVQLAALLRAEGVSVADPVIVARTGWTTAELRDGIARAKPTGPFDLVTLLIGVNNQYRGRTEDEYRQEFVELLNTARDFAAGDDASRVIVLSIPDWGATPFGRRSDPTKVGAAIDRLNAVNREETSRFGARYVNVTPVSRRASREPKLIAEDDLHPSGVMYAEWARLVLPEARAVLSPADNPRRQ